MENGSRLCCRTLAGATWPALPAHVRCHKVHHGQNEETAKAEYLSKLVYREGDRAVDVLSQAKRAGVGGTRNRTPWRPMPTLMMQDGNEVGTRRDRDKAWLEYFGEQECGEVIKLDELIHDPMEPLVIDEQLSWECCHLPSLGEVEHVLRQAPCRRATGLDAVPGEILRSSHGLMSAILQPLMVGNTLHEFHMGGRKHVPVVMPAMYVLALQRSGCRRRCSTATLFLDTHAASQTFGRIQKVDPLMGFPIQYP